MSHNGQTPIDILMGVMEVAAEDIDKLSHVGREMLLMEKAIISLLIDKGIFTERQLMGRLQELREPPSGKKET